MSDLLNLLILSDIHYACDAERQRGHPEQRAIQNPFLRILAKTFRHFIWQRDIFAHNHRVDQFIQSSGEPDHVVAVGDYSCDSDFVGMSAPDSFTSVVECLARLRGRYGDRFHAVLGDHELGKMSLFGGSGGPRLASWQRLGELALRPFWEFSMGRYRLIAITSTVVALPVFEQELLPGEVPAWREIRHRHLEEISRAFASLKLEERVFLFCHDPTALPFLHELEEVQKRWSQFEQTFIGHLHSNLVFWKSQLLAGMPPIRFLGNSIRRMSIALHQARLWKPFKVRLCPALAGIQLLKDGGYYRLLLDPLATRLPQYQRVVMR